jgi:hypothetical protein
MIVNDEKFDSGNKIKHDGWCYECCREIFFYKVIVVVILISKDNSDWYKKTATWVGARKVNRPMKSKEEKGEIMVFLNEFIIIGCLLYVHVCVNWMKLAWKEWGNS